ncbi:MAG: SseB family protein [Pseudomonadota bacterium]
MADETTLDVAHASMMAEPEDSKARLAFYERLAACELFLMLETEPDTQDDAVAPQVFELEHSKYVLAFDREDRLAAFAEQAVPYIAVSGRALAGMLARQGIGIALNLDVAPSSILLPEEAVAWLHSAVGNLPDQVETRISEISAPGGLPEPLLAALDARLANAMGLAERAYLAAITYETGGRGHLLAFVGAVPQAQEALAGAAAEAMTFSGLEAGAMDIGFFAASDPVIARLERHGLRFDLPQMQSSEFAGYSAPGSDPDKPPRLK